MKYAAREHHWLPRDVWGMGFSEFIIVFCADEVPVTDKEALEWLNKQRVKKGLPKLDALPKPQKKASRASAGLRDAIQALGRRS